jgi:zinc protease
MGLASPTARRGPRAILPPSPRRLFRQEGDLLKAIACLLLLLGIALPTAAAAAEDAKIFPYQARVETLDNGLQVILVPMSSGGLVAYWTLVRTGSRDEFEQGRSGFAHFFEHMMFRGTEKYPAAVYQGKLTEIGADANAFTTDDFTAYHLGITTEDVELVMDLESDRFQNLKYPLDMFQTEAGAVLGEYRKNRSNPFFVLYEAIRKTAFKEHTYSHTTMGFVEDIQAMPNLFDHSRSFFDRFYRPENSILLIVGDIDVDKTLALAKKYYGPWQRGYKSPTLKFEPEQKEELKIEVPYEGSSLPILWLAYKNEGYDPGNKGMVALQLLCDLAFGETSAIHKKLVLDQQLVEFVNCDNNLNRDPNLVDIVTRVKDPANVAKVQAEIEATIAQFQQNPPAADQLAALQSRFKYRFLMNLDTPMAVAQSMVPFLAITAKVGSVDQSFRTVDAVKPADIQAAARRYFVPQHRTVAVLKGAN